MSVTPAGIVTLAEDYGIAARLPELGDACRALGLDFAGVDILFGKDDEPIVCEVNSNPHFKSSLDCTGVDMSPLILSHIKERVQKR